MLSKIIYWSINNKLIVSVLTLILIVYGVIELQSLPIDAVPDITNNQVQIITVSPSAGAEDIERQITFPVEQAVSSIAGIEELRSFSRFGLSVVTVVFKESTNVFWARQQVAERLNEVANDIPPSLGKPNMAPLTSGLGEIYQYTISAAPGYESTYSSTELRSIQDWLVRRQLLGVTGVADVSGFGGNLKTYEISINPHALKSFNLTIADVFRAVEVNNQNTGGAYIEREGMATYIRAEGLLHNVKDIEQITVAHNEQGMPITINQVARVQLGKSIRYGALTYNNQGEAVGGIVMMLKGANSDKTIQAVKERVQEIKSILPKGVIIEPYLDRSDLVQRAIHTVSSNLIDGALIVIFVLVLLLGNLRAGLVVASVIPLAMLFAVILMNAFGVSGNLMSLGALDFGLIVDGAVIIVEATLHVLAIQTGPLISQVHMNEKVYGAASKFSKSAVFGQLIILVVYIPILTLIGIEGKMFKPMALTVMFAIIGALILSLTYVPMVSSLFLSKRIKHKKSISDRLMSSITNRYKPIFLGVLRRQKLIIMVIIGVFISSIFVFNRLGAEFIPNLDEGDFAVEMRLIPGASLTNTIDKSEQSAKVILANFPEVKKVVGKIGTAEIPTDPMPMEACDLMIILKDKSAWVSAETKEDLATKMKATLEEQVPGVEFGFLQPIQMRFNELMTGAKQDVVVKIYGEDFKLLEKYAKSVGTEAQSIAGVQDLYVEQLEGVPQLKVNYDRMALARYGVSVEDVNNALNSGFAGTSAGFVYEGEKRFSLVIRLDSLYRSHSMDLKDIFVDSKSNVKIPITELAKINYDPGLNQIQRDNAKRRILVGFNVRGRDVKSVVDELKNKVSNKMKMAPGYQLSVGGSFKNLEEAASRLLVAVPAALLLIFFLLYLTFNSLKQSIMIFTAIPLAAIGGIWALALRDMPFSISAGIGFIALFGVAVLNGIVLITEYNTLLRNGMKNVLRVVVIGTLSRLRPVLLTATVASLGFLPMALSHGSGAEVQKPLATVVIGGLITATFLTLFFLPILYFIFARKKNNSNLRTAGLSIALLCIGFPSFSQQPTLVQLQQRAITLNPNIKVDSLRIVQAKFEAAQRVQIQKTDINVLVGQYNSNVKTDNNFTIQQRIPYPMAFVSKNNYAIELGKERIYASETRIWGIKKSVALSYENWRYLLEQKRLLLIQDSALTELDLKLKLQVELGEITSIEAWLVASEHLLLAQKLINIETDLQAATAELASLVYLEPQDFVKTDWPYTILPLESKDSIYVKNTPQFKVMQQAILTLEANQKLEKHLAFPELQVGYFNQTLIGNVPVNLGVGPFTSKDRFQGATIGISVPLFSRTNQQQRIWFQLEAEKVKQELKQSIYGWNARYQTILLQYSNAKSTFDALNKTSEMLKNNMKSVVYEQLNAGEIDQLDAIKLKLNIDKINLSEIEMIHQLNMLSLELKYLSF